MMTYGWVLVIAFVSFFAGFLLGRGVKNTQPAGSPETQAQVPLNPAPLPAESRKEEPQKPAEPVRKNGDDMDQIAVAIAVAAHNAAE